LANRGRELAEFGVDGREEVRGGAAVSGRGRVEQARDVGHVGGVSSGPLRALGNTSQDARAISTVQSWWK
jgi:hypothetical protein